MFGVRVDLAFYCSYPAASPVSEGFGVLRQNASTPPLRASILQEQSVLSSFSVARSISGQATATLLRSAMEALPHTPESSIMLVSDGGRENVNISVKDYLASVPIELYIAYVDVSFSNSMIEAVNKILKYRYIFRKNILSFCSVDQVVKILLRIIASVLIMRCMVSVPIWKGG